MRRFRAVLQMGVCKKNKDFCAYQQICNPLRNLSATRPLARLIWGFASSVKTGLHTQTVVCAKLVLFTFTRLRSRLFWR